MTRIIRWNPYHNMMVMRNAMDRLVDSESLNTTDWPRNWGLALDVAESEDEYLVKASVPGINPDDLEITFEKDIVTIKGEVKSEEEHEDSHYHLRGRRSGNFCRSFSLPTTIDVDAIEAVYEAGVLSLRLPKSEEAKPKRIEVKAVDSAKMIEG